MRPLLLVLLCACPALAQQAPVPRAPGPGVESNTRQLLERVENAPRLDLEEHSFGLRPPQEGWHIDEPSSIAVGKDGVFYVLQRGTAADPVIAFDAEGTVLRSWGRGLYTIPHSIRVDPAGNVWTVDAGNSQVYQFDPQGEQLFHIDVGEMPDGETPFRGTTDIAFATDGNVLIADGYGNARILEYTPDGRLVRQFGEPGSGPGQLRLPHALQINERGTVYVADRENGRIQRFTREGKYIDQWDGLGRVFCLQLDGDAIWLASHPLDNPPTWDPGWIFRLDRNSGVVQGLVETPGTHSITLTTAGEPVTGDWPTGEIVWFRKRP